MEGLKLELANEISKSMALQSSYDDEMLLRLKTEGSLQELRRIHKTLACDCEMSEEFIVNKLICKIERAKHDKEQLANDLEREEECLINNLQRQLSALKREKQRTESEAGDLKKQLELMRLEQEKVARKVEAEQELISNNLFKKLQKTLQEKCELENQLSRSISARNSMCSSLNSSITGFSDFPDKVRSNLTDLSILLPSKKLPDAAFVSPHKWPPLSPGHLASYQSNSSENVFI